MHTRLLEQATHEQLKSFLMDEFGKLKSFDKDLYEDMEEGLYEHVYGEHFSEWKYDCAVSKFQNADKTVGPHWTVTQISDLAKSKGVSFTRFNPYDFAYVMNVMYSDYYPVVGDSAEMCFKLAKAFLDDPDAPEGKAYRYYKAMR